MTEKRKSKRVLWEIMSQLEEAGEEDVCSLLNQVMGAQPYFGSGRDLAEYLEAVTALENQGELRVREYRIEGGRNVYADVVTGVDRPTAAFQYDSADQLWKWKGVARQMVELPED